MERHTFAIQISQMCMNMLLVSVFYLIYGPKTHTGLWFAFASGVMIFTFYFILNITQIKSKVNQQYVKHKTYPLGALGIGGVFVLPICALIATVMNLNSEDGSKMSIVDIWCLIASLNVLFYGLVLIAYIAASEYFRKKNQEQNGNENH